MPRIKAQATSVNVISPAPPGKTNLIEKAPTPAIKITETTNKFLFSLRSTF